MKTVVVFYSLTGKTAEIAKAKARDENADLVELKDRKKLSMFGAYVFGSFKAMKQKKAKLQDFSADFSQYDKVIVAMPVWASMPAPAFNNVVEVLPSDKLVEVILASAGGDSKDASVKIRQALQSKGCTLLKMTDIKTS
ncbi:MAG: flavodoxin family protein [Saccharofermentanales bacterium]